MEDLKKKQITDLVALLKTKREALKSFYFGLAGSKVRNIKEGSSLKKQIARILNELSFRKNQPSSLTKTEL